MAKRGTGRRSSPRGYDIEHWALDKRVPIGLIVALMIQASSAIWWASGMNRDIMTLKDNISQYQSSWKSEIADIKQALKDFGGSRDRVATLEGEMKAIRESLTRVERLMERFAGSQDRRVMR